MANTYGMVMRYLPWRVRKDITIHTFVRSVILEGLFQTTTKNATIMIPSNAIIGGNRSAASSVTASIHSPSLVSMVSATKMNKQISNLHTFINNPQHSIE